MNTHFSYIFAMFLAVAPAFHKSAIPETVVYPGKVSVNHYGKCYLATSDIEPGTVVERFVGREVEFKNIPDSQITYAANFGNNLWIIPMTNARYINHSCDPNCVIKGDSDVVAIRPIQAGEEITVDYVSVSQYEFELAPHEFFWDSRWTFDCQCGADNCHKRIDRYFIVPK